MQAEQTIQEAANQHYGSQFDAEQRELIEAALDYEAENTEDARQELEEQVLSFSLVITNHRQETRQWEILLGTGGPADRVWVETDFDGNIESATYQYQDWFQPWTDAEDQDEELVTQFAQVVGYYEIES